MMTRKIIAQDENKEKRREKKDFNIAFGVRKSEKRKRKKVILEVPKRTWFSALLEEK